MVKVWKAGCGVTALGVLLTLGSCGLFGMAISERMEQRQILTRDLDLARIPVTVEFSVDEDSRVRVDFHAALQPTESDLADADSSAIIASANLNYEYRVRSESGEVLDRGAGTLSGSEIIPEAGRREGSLFGEDIEVRAQGSAFDVTGPASCLVEVDLATEDAAGRQLLRAQVLVFDRVGRNVGGFTAGGLLSMLLGPVVTSGGVLLFFAGIIFGKKRRSGQE